MLELETRRVSEDKSTKNAALAHALTRRVTNRRLLSIEAAIAQNEPDCNSCKQSAQVS